MVGVALYAQQTSVKGLQLLRGFGIDGIEGGQEAAGAQNPTIVNGAENGPHPDDGTAEGKIEGIRVGLADG